MKKLLLATALLFTLSACGVKDDSSSSATVALDDSPQITVPAGASLEVYDCDEISEFILNGNSATENYSYSGKSSGWTEGDFRLEFDEDANGSFKSLTKHRRETISSLQYRSFADISVWNLKQGKWVKRSYTSEKLFSRENETSSFQLVSYKKDGVDTDYHWNSEVLEETEKGYKTIARHKNPGSRNNDGRTYLKIEETCTYLKR